MVFFSICFFFAISVAIVYLILFAFYPLKNRAKIAAWEITELRAQLNSFKGYSQVGLYFRVYNSRIRLPDVTHVVYPLLGKNCGNKLLAMLVKPQHALEQWSRSFFNWEQLPNCGAMRHRVYLSPIKMFLKRKIKSSQDKCFLNSPAQRTFSNSKHR